MAAPLATFDFRVQDHEQRSKGGKFDRPYWVYHIRCRTSAEAYQRKELEPVRRYSDFDWFRTQLAEEYPFCVVPPIPEKEIVKGTVEKLGGAPHNPQLLEYRQRALRKFLVRLGAHPLLQRAALLQEFLEMDETEWERRMKQPAKHGGDGYLAHLVSGVGAAVASQWAPPAMQETGATVGQVLAPAELPSNPNVWLEVEHYVAQLEDSLATLKARLQQLVMRRKGTGTSLHDFGRSFMEVGHIEANLEREDTPLSRAVVSVGRHAQELATIYADHADQETRCVVESLLYYHGMCAAVRETLKRLQKLIAARDGAVQQHKDATAGIERLAAKQQVDKIAKAEREQQQLAEKMADGAKGVRAFEGAFRDEMRRFHKDKQYDMKAMLKSFVDLQMDYAQKMKRSWEALLPTVEEVRL
jgi:sorting nexin-1/2